MTRRGLMLGAGGAAAAGLWPAYFEPRWLEVTRRRVRLRSQPLQETVRLLHLSDFHASFVVPMTLIERSIELGLAERPDLICLTGDFITFRQDFDDASYIAALRRLSTAAPAYAVLGNHDGGIWAREHGGHEDHAAVERLLTRGGIQLLHNRSERVTIRGERLALAGTGDLWTEEIDAPAAFRGVESGDAVILLSHNPDGKEALGRYRWDLMLSGHTHGGQVMVPFRGPSYAPVIDKNYVAGLKPWRDRQIHVTRGVGSLGGVRWMCRPEVSVLTLE